MLIDKGVPIARMEAANLVSPVTADFITSKPQTQKLSEEERQKVLMEKLDLSGLAGWTDDLSPRPEIYSWSITTYSPWRRAKLVKPRW